MPEEDGTEIRRVVEILPRETSSRRLTSDQIGALLNDLNSVVERFSRFTVWRFGQHDRLEYPVQRLPEAIDNYDVKRIYGRGFINDDEKDDTFIEIDLWAGGNLGDWKWLFRLSGPKTKVDQSVIILREHIDRWQKTWHHWFHHIFWNWTIAFALLLLLGAQIGAQIGAFIFSTKTALGLHTVVLIYLLGFMVMVLFGTGILAPFIWFYRPGSPIEIRRQWLPRLSVFAVLAAAAGAAGNLIWNMLKN